LRLDPIAGVSVPLNCLERVLVIIYLGAAQLLPSVGAGPAAPRVGWDWEHIRYLICLRSPHL